MSSNLFGEVPTTCTDVQMRRGGVIASLAVQRYADGMRLWTVHPCIKLAGT